MESLELDIAAAFPQHIHHRLEVLWLTDVPGHDVEVVTFQQQFTQQLQTHPTQTQYLSTYCLLTTTLIAQTDT